MSEEEIKTMVNNAFKKFSKELEENPDNVFNYLELQKKYNSVLKTKVKLQQENQKYKEVINELRDYLKARLEVCDNRLSTPFCNFEKVTKEMLILSDCLEKLEELEVEHE